MIFLHGDTEGQRKNSDFSLYFFNKDISVTVKDTDMNFFMVVLHTYSEGSLSQISCLGPSFILHYLENNV